MVVVQSFVTKERRHLAHQRCSGAALRKWGSSDLRSAWVADASYSHQASAGAYALCAVGSGKTTFGLPT